MKRLIFCIALVNTCSLMFGMNMPQKFDAKVKGNKLIITRTLDEHGTLDNSFGVSGTVEQTFPATPTLKTVRKINGQVEIEVEAGGRLQKLKYNEAGQLIERK